MDIGQQADGVIDPKRLRRAFGTFATGVTVVTVGESNPHGMTANSFTPVSLDPPLVLICVERQAVMHHALVEATRFGVSVLGSGQEAVARHFADRSRPLGIAQFDPVEWARGPLTGVPLIVGALAHFECQLWRSYDGGDHTVFLGRPLALRWSADDDALLFFRGNFGRLGLSASEVTR